MPRLRAPWVPRAATYRASAEFSSDFILGRDSIYATLLSSTPVGGDRG